MRKPHTHFFVRWIFLRILCFCLIAAFLSVLVQLVGLFGENGILPVRNYLQVPGGFRPEIFLQAPTIFWLNSSDAFMQFVCVSGACVSALGFCGVFTGPMILLGWFLYLSICIVGQDFMGFQWDSLLLETCLLAAFYAPWSLQEASPFSKEFKYQNDGSQIFLVLLRLLLLKLMLLSGLVKIFSHDPSWADFSAMSFHYETQPLPTPLSWFLNKLPLDFQKLSTMIVFAVELILPFFILGIRPMRIFAGVVFIIFQILIILSGNYAFFNVLTIALSFTLFDDAALRSFLPLSLRIAPVPGRLSFSQLYLETVKSIVPAILIGLLSLTCFTGVFLGTQHIAQPFKTALAYADGLRSFNSYGLFAIMTTKRPEIIIEGSNDGKEWKAYEFKYKPGDLRNAPCMVAPHQPRMDWQMWFAALAPERVSPWFIQLVDRLLEGRPEVLGLFASNPFPQDPPKMIRARLYDYHFSDFDGLFKNGQWWTRTETGTYLPIRTVQDKSILQY